MNALSENFKEKLNEVSIPLTADSHPEMPVEERQAKNAIKFTLNNFQVRMSELHTVSNLIKLFKSLQKTNTKLILQDNTYETYNTELVDVCFGLGASCNLGNLQKYDRLSKIYRAIQIVRERQ